MESRGGKEGEEGSIRGRIFHPSLFPLVCQTPHYFLWLVYIEKCRYSFYICYVIEMFLHCFKKLFLYFTHCGGHFLMSALG